MNYSKERELQKIDIIPILNVWCRFVASIICSVKILVGSTLLWFSLGSLKTKYCKV
jgi:hypothetical protein